MLHYEVSDASMPFFLLLLCTKDSTSGQNKILRKAIANNPSVNMELLNTVFSLNNIFLMT